MAKKDKINLLKINCETIKRNIYEFEEFFNNFDQINGNCLEVEDRLNTVIKSFEKLDNVEDELFSLGQPKNLERKNLNDKFFEISCKVKFYLQNKKLNADSDSQSVNLLNSSNNENSNYQLKFKGVPIPEFDGQYTEWHSFKNKFKSFITSQRCAEAHKLVLLQSAMKKDAAHKIDHLPVTDENYQKAWKILENSYKNQKMIKLSYINKILNSPNIQSEDYKLLNQLADTSIQCFESLKSLKIKIPSDFIVCLIERKLDPVTLKLWEESSSHDDFETLDNITKFIYRHAARLSMTKNSNSNRKRSNGDDKNHNHQKKAPN